jgi:VanZ family protein
VLLVGPVVALMAAIFLASSTSNPPAPPGVSDKVLHMAAYAALAVLVFRALSGGLPARLTRAAVLATVLITIGYGVTDEVHQMFVPQRSPELYDLFADAAGAAAGLIACWAWAILEIPAPESQIPNPKQRR